MLQGDLAPAQLTADLVVIRVMLVLQACRKQELQGLEGFLQDASCMKVLEAGNMRQGQLPQAVSKTVRFEAVRVKSKLH
jgi:hypothetical protein